MRKRERNVMKWNLKLPRVEFSRVKRLIFELFGVIRFSQLDNGKWLDLITYNSVLGYDGRGWKEMGEDVTLHWTNVRVTIFR